jgi:hypothetical protein
MRMSHRPANPLRARNFGRARTYAVAAPEHAPSGLSDDLRIFVFTFLGGFLFMAIYLA